MIVISKPEKDYICSHINGFKVHRTVKKKSNRHKYYMEESREAMRLLSLLRAPADAARR